MNKTVSVDVRDFEREVLERSHEVPVLADFWAEWCGPCRILSPVLENLASQSDGAWVLAKVDTEEHPEVAQRLGIQSIPNVKLFHEGKVVDEFVGALPERTIAQWLKKNLPGRTAGRIKEAVKLLDDGRMDAAQHLLEEMLADEPGNEEARALLAKACIFSDPAKAAALVPGIDDPRYFEIKDSIVTFLHLFEVHEHPETLAESSVRQRYLDAAGDICDRKFDHALEKFIAVIRDDRQYDDDGSRKACIAIFKYLGEEHPTTMKYRREFGMALYV